MNLTITIKDCQLLEKLEICNSALLAEKAQRYDMPPVDSHCIYYNKAGGSGVAQLERGGVLGGSSCHQVAKSTDPGAPKSFDPGLEGRPPLIYISLRQPVRDLHVCDLFTLTWSSVRIICMKCLCIYMSVG